MDKLLTLDHVIRIVTDYGCKDCKKLIDRKCAKDCKIFGIKCALVNADADAVLAALAVDARLV